MLKDLIALPDDSKVWIYQSDSPFNETEKEEVRGLIRSFVNSWQSHGHTVEAYGNLFHRQFIVIIANETLAGVSGCSIDGSVNLIRHISDKYNKDPFNRLVFTYMDEEESVHSIHQSDLASAYSEGRITDETLFFNNLVNTKDQFINEWLVPLKNSWHHKFI